MLNINFWNIAFTVINLLVLYLFLKHFLMKPLMEIMEKRQAQVEADLNDAASEKQEAIRLKEQYEGSLREAEDQVWYQPISLFDSKLLSCVRIADLKGEFKNVGIDFTKWNKSVIFASCS